MVTPSQSGSANQAAGGWISWGPGPASQPLKGPQPESGGHREKLDGKQGLGGADSAGGVRRHAQGCPGSGESPGHLSASRCWRLQGKKTPSRQPTLCCSSSGVTLGPRTVPLLPTNPVPGNLTLPQISHVFTPTQADFPTNAHSQNFPASA